MANGLTQKTARDLLESRKEEFSRALVNRIDPEAFIRVAHMAMSKNPTLLECTPASLLMALLEAASLGLMPNGVLGHAYIIPYRNKGVMEAQFQPGYRGLIDLARRSGHVKAIVPRTVNKNDVFEVEYGLDERIRHVPNLDDPGEMRFVYAVAKLNDDSPQFHIMPLKDVERIRKKSRAANNGPWVTDFEAMAWKTVIKQLVKFLPLSLEVDQAVQQDNAVEYGGDMPVFSPTVPERSLPQPESRAASLRGRLQQRQISAAPADEPAFAPKVQALAADLEEEIEAEQPAQADAPQAAAAGSGYEVDEFLEAVASLSPEGGDATKKQRSELKKAADQLLGQGTEEAVAVHMLADAGDLGKVQADALLSLAKVALDAAAQPANLFE